MPASRWRRKWRYGSWPTRPAAHEWNSSTETSDAWAWRMAKRCARASTAAGPGCSSCLRRRLRRAAILVIEEPIHHYGTNEGAIHMSEFVIHSVPGSPFGRAVLVALEEKGAPYRFVPVAPGTGRTPEHLACHPFGRVPYVEHGGFMLYETAAIVRYVDRVLPEPKLTPANPQAAARMDQLMNVNDWYLFQGVANVIAFQRIIRPRLMGLDSDEDAIAAAMPKAHVVFGELSRLLGDR